MNTIRKFILATLFSVSVFSALAAQKQWTGLGATLNWSDGNNWSDNAATSPGDILYFEDLLFGTGFTNAAKVVNNVVEANTAVGVMNFTPRSFSTTNRFYTTLIPADVTLTLGGLGATPPAALVVGDIPGDLGWLSSGSWTNYSTITGPGTLALNDSSTVISVGWRNRATLDLTGLNTFTPSVRQVWVGTSLDNPNTTGPTGWLLLAKTNTLTTAPNLAAPGVLLGHATNANGTAVVELGQVNNVNSDGLVVGARRSGQTFLRFGSAYVNGATPGQFTLRGSAGGSTPAPVFSVGDAAANADGYHTLFSGTAVGAAATADFSGGTVDILAESIYVGRSSAATQAATGTGNGTLIVEKGTVTTTNLYVAYKTSGATNASIGQGLLTLRSNAVMNVVNNAVLVFRTNNATGFIDDSRITVNDNAVLNVGGSLTTTHTIGSWVIPSVVLGGGTINMSGGGVVNVPKLIGFGNLTNASSITITNAFAVNTDTAPGTLNLGNNLTLSNPFGLTFNLGADTTVGGGVNDYLSVANNVSFNNNPIMLTFSAPLVAGTYSLIGYGGTQTGSLTWTNPTRSAIGLVQGGGTVAIVVTNLTPATLTWRSSGASGQWGSPVNNTAGAATNWNGNTERFLTFDHVVFDDTGVAPTVTITNAVIPASITVNNSSVAYTIGQSGGRISGFTGITKNGTGTLTLSGGTANDFTGPINLNAGTIRLGSFNPGIFGNNTTSTLNISSGATLDLNGQSPGSSFAPFIGRIITVSGTGVGGAGAIANNAATTGGNLTTPQVTLAGDATFSCPTAARLIVTGMTPPYNGLFDLAGNTLTITGTEFRLSQVTMTNAGTVNVNAATLSIGNSIIAGTGNINLGNKGLLFNSWTTGYLAKPITVNGGYFSTVSATTTPLLIGSPITLDGSLSYTNLQPTRLTNVISGTGSLVKYGSAALTLEAANTYAGVTTISAGALTLVSPGSLASPLIQVDSTLDVSAYILGYNLANGQTLSVSALGAVSGSINVNNGSTYSSFGTNAGSVNVAAGGTVVAGSPLVQGTLTINNNLTFNGGTNIFKLGSTTTPGSGVNDLVVIAGNLTFAAPTTIRIQPVATLSGLPYTLFQYSGNLSGIGNVTVTSDTRYNFTLDTSTPGEVRVVVGGTAGNLVWQGGALGSPNAWDVLTTANWLNGVLPDKFYQGDSVTFDDTATTPLVTVSTQVKPSSITNNSAGTYTLNGTGSLLAGNLVANSGRFVIANTNNNLFNGEGIVLNGGDVAFNQSIAASVTTKLSGAIGSLEKSGVNTLTLTGPDSTNLSAAVNIKGGTLRPTTPNALGSGTVSIYSGATLDINGQWVNAGPVQAEGAGADGQGAINNRGLTQTNAIANLTLTADVTLGAASNRWDIAGSLQGNNHTLVKTGTAELRVKSASGTGLGNIDVQAGRLIFSELGNDLGNNETTVTVRSNATLGFARGIQAGNKPGYLAPGGSLYASDPANRYDGSIVLSNGLVQLEPNAQLTLGGNLSGPATLNLRGVVAGNFGTLTLAGTNSYTGGTLVNEGVFVVANSSALPVSSNVVLSSRSAFSSSGHPIIQLGTNVTSPASVMLDMQTIGSAGAAQATLAGDGGTWAGPINITGANDNCVANFTAGRGGLTVNGAINAAGFIVGSAANGGLKINGDMAHATTMQGGAITLNNPLIMNAPLSCPNWQNLSGYMTKLVLNGATNYWVSAFFNTGIIQIGANNAIPALSPITVNNLFSGADHRFVVDLNGHNQALGSFAHGAGGPAEQPAWFGNSSTNTDSTLTHIGAITNTWAAFIVDAFDTSAPIQRRTGLTVSSGYLRLVTSQYTDPNNVGVFPAGPAPGPMTNTYSGPTLVTGGTLRVDAGIPNSPVTVSGTGKLMGTGTLGGPVTIAAGGTLAPGASIGTLTMTSNLVLNAGSKCEFEVNLVTSTNDKVVGLSNVTYGGTLVVTNIGAQPFTNGTIVPLFSAATYTAGTVVVQPSPGFGLRWDTSFLAVDGTLRVVAVSTTPIPITAAVSGGGTSLDLSWPPDHIGWLLQGQTNGLGVGITTNWFGVAGSTITNQIQVPIVRGNPAVFFRLVYP